MGLESNKPFKVTVVKEVAKNLRKRETLTLLKTDTGGTSEQGWRVVCNNNGGTDQSQLYIRDGMGVVAYGGEQSTTLTWQKKKAVNIPVENVVRMAYLCSNGTEERYSYIHHRTVTGGTLPNGIHVWACYDGQHQSNCGIRIKDGVITEMLMSKSTLAVDIEWSIDYYEGVD